jgi:hypothetical protein
MIAMPDKENTMQMIRHDNKFIQISILIVLGNILQTQTVSLPMSLKPHTPFLIVPSNGSKYLTQTVIK